MMLSRYLAAGWRCVLGGIVAVILVGCVSSAPPNDPPPVVTKLALVLGGGAARGFAHIGVIKVLENAGIQPDIVVGTSAGSVVGTLYASGYDGFRLQSLAFGLDESRIRDVTLGSRGIIKGEKLENYVNELVHRRPIERFPRRLGVVATNLDTGRRILFQRGNAGQAVRASSSVPGVFEPVVIRGQRYVDGGVSSPVPVDAARDMGATVVVAVDISTPPTQTRAENALSILDQTFTIMGRQLSAAELSRADVVIRPAIGGIGSADFSYKHQAILEGERAAQAALPLIQRKLGKISP